MPKTGGTTLKNIIKRNVNPQESFDIYENLQQREAKLIDLSNKNVSCIQGHLLFGVHHYFKQPSTYITMLREPVERILSEYYFIRNRPSHVLYHKVINMTLNEYQHELENMNLQTRYICGKSSGPITENNLIEAKENILNHFAIVGITEMFNDSIFLMKKKFGWKNISYKKENITKNRLLKTELSPKLIESIKKNNKLDFELYHFAKSLLIKQL